jgi:predicted YcjX-like family ATPase
MKRHPLDPFSLVFGIMFAGLGGLLLNTEIDVADFSGRWLLPLPLLFVGFLFVAFGLNRLRRSREIAAAEASEDTIEESVVE